MGVNKPVLTPVAKVLRKRSTDTEARLWSRLRDRRFGRFKFRRQHPMGRYVVDFVCLEAKTVIEVDGGQHNESWNKEADRERDEWLAGEGYKVLRFWDNEVFENLDGVLERIREALVTPHPGPLPQGARGKRIGSK